MKCIFGVRISVVCVLVVFSLQSSGCGKASSTTPEASPATSSSPSVSTTSKKTICQKEISTMPGVSYTFTIRITALNPYDTAKSDTNIAEVIKDGVTVAISEVKWSGSNSVSYNMGGSCPSGYWTVYYSTTSKYAKYGNCSALADYTVILTDADCTSQDI